MESNYPDTDNEPGHEYFSYRQYMNRLFYEHNWRPQSPSESAACTSDGESVSSHRSAVKRSQVTPPKKAPLHAIRRKRLVTQRNARQVSQFRKWLLPKTAFETLQELSTPSHTEVTIYPSNQGAKAEIVVNNVTYAAIDHDKNAAKDKASEQALRDLTAPSGDLPMEYLAPFAMHKLMAEWKAPALDTSGKETSATKLSSPETPELAPADRRATSGRGIQVVQPFCMGVKEFDEQRAERFLPEVPASAEQPAGGSGISTVAVPGPVFATIKPYNMPKVRKTVADLPRDASTYHPGCLFAYMRPQCKYKELALCCGYRTMVFVARLTTDGRNFEGKGSSRKRARFAAAMEACKVLFGVVFDEGDAKNFYYKR